jgi:hypothetical protein
MPQAESSAAETSCKKLRNSRETPAGLRSSGWPDCDPVSGHCPCPHQGAQVFRPISAAAKDGYLRRAGLSSAVSAILFYPSGAAFGYLPAPAKPFRKMLDLSIFDPIDENVG